MSNFVGIISGAPPSSGSITLDLAGCTARVANLLRRNNINTEIAFWLDFSLKELCDEVDFPELRTVGGDIACVAAKYDYPLPADYGRMASVYYKCTSDSPVSGYNLVPLPRSFYKGDTADYERLLNNGNPTKGNPRYYFVDHNRLIIYPAYRDDGGAGVLIPTYFRIPEDWTVSNQLPKIDARWHHYLIWLAYFWGMTFDNKSAESIVAIKYWEGKFERTIDRIKKKVSRKENTRLTYDLPDAGMEDADGAY